jgi:chorismate mutase
VPSKKGKPITDEERAKRILEAAREQETDNDPASFERAFASVVSAPQKPKKPEPLDNK